MAVASSAARHVPPAPLLPLKPISRRASPPARLQVAARASGGRSSSGDGGNGLDTRLVEVAVKEPVSFLGGIFAGFLALDLQQEPLRSWVEQTAAEAGIKYQATVERLEQERQARSSS